MNDRTLQTLITKVLAEADITINGTRPWDLQVYNYELYRRVVTDGNLGFGEAYMDGWWDSDQVDELISRMLRGRVPEKIFQRLNLNIIGRTLRRYLQSAGRRQRAFEVGKRHYDLSNDLFYAMLDRRMVYTCGYWPNARTLDEAQESKLDLVCRKIQLTAGMRVLDIGGGWGSFAKFAAERYGADVVNITVSKEQVSLANELCRGLPVENRLQDYRDEDEKFDAIASLGMFEHVGPRYYSTYFDVVDRCLKDDGLFLLHTIGSSTSWGAANSWVNKYIFPNSALPTARVVTAAVHGKFVIEDWHNFGADYDTTLMAWHANIERAWPKLGAMYDERFHRLWRYYLLSSAGAFRARHLQLWQIVLSRRGVPGGYRSIR